MSAQFKIGISKKRSIREILPDDDMDITLPIKKRKLNELEYDDRLCDGEQSPKKIFAVFVCGPDPNQCVENPTAPNQRGQTYVNLLENERSNEEWVEYMIYHDEFPSKQEMETFSAVVITGSVRDAYTNDVEWKLKLQDIIRGIYHENRIKLFGVCFGHQIIAHSLRNTQQNKVEIVGRNKTREQMEIGLISVDLTNEFHSFWSRFDIKVNKNALRLHTAHQDVVYTLPSQLRDTAVMASSQYTDIEMYHIGDNIIGVQGHPEFTTPYLINVIKRNTKYLSKIFTDDELKDIMNNIKESEANREEWKYMFVKWIRS